MDDDEPHEDTEPLTKPKSKKERSPAQIASFEKMRAAATAKSQGSKALDPTKKAVLAMVKEKLNGPPKKAAPPPESEEEEEIVEEVAPPPKKVKAPKVVEEPVKAPKKKPPIVQEIEESESEEEIIVVKKKKKRSFTKLLAIQKKKRGMRIGEQESSLRVKIEMAQQERK